MNDMLDKIAQIADRLDTVERTFQTVTGYSGTGHTHSYAATSHTHSYLPTTGGSLSGDVGVTGSVTGTGVADFNEFRGDNGSASDPSFTFTSDESVGMYLHAGGDLAFSTAGIRRMSLHWSGMYLFQKLDMGGKDIINVDDVTGSGNAQFAEYRASNGSQASPSLCFTDNQNTGIYNDVNRVGVTVNGSIKALFASDRLYLWGATGNVDYIGPINGSWFYNVTGSTKFYFNKSLNITNSLSSHTGTLELQDRNTTVVRLTGTDAANGNVLIFAGSNNGSGTQSALRIYTKSSSTAALGGAAGMTFQTTYSTDRHVHARVYYSGGDQLGFRNYENTAWVSLKASSFAVASSRELKHNIRTGRDERGILDFAIPGPRKMAFAQWAKLRPVLFDDNVQERLVEWAGCEGHRDVKGQDSSEDVGPVITRLVHHKTREECSEAGCESTDNTQAKYHFCDEYECGGTAELPCSLVGMHVNRPGMIAEELDEVFPECVSRDMFGENLGIDYNVLTVESVNIIQHLLEDRHDARVREAKNFWAGREIKRSTDARIEKLESAIALLTE
jgi:hypothetical protein